VRGDGESEILRETRGLAVIESGVGAVEVWRGGVEVATCVGVAGPGGELASEPIMALEPDEDEAGAKLFQCISPATRARML
jgi:hypothetical protein